MTDLDDLSLFFLSLIAAVLVGTYIADFIFDQYQNHKLARRLFDVRRRFLSMLKRLKGK